MYCAWQFDQRDRYWQAAMLASKLMTPKIIHLKNKCQNIRYKHDDDFEMAILETIYLAIPEYEKSKSNFAKFIVTYMMHTAYVYENDLSEYSRQQLELFIDSYDKRIEEGLNNTDNIRYKACNSILDSKDNGNSFTARINRFCNNEGADFKILVADIVVESTVQCTVHMFL